ncbi:hypothetical protein [Erythrobacter sp. Alg231-14]|uniref:hypothetical protein n=1 Tax=Erythrobacter sp. Alg231-14 TaxID=1922225 RepID=UPI00307BD051
MAFRAKESDEVLSRIKDHLANQNWIAIVLEFLIVVSGVAIGFQITEWNRGRLAESDYQIARDRLVDETRTNIANFEELAEIFEEKERVVGSAIELLRSCPTGAEAEQEIVKALEALRGTRSPVLLTAAARRITEEQTLVARQNDEERLRLEQFLEMLIASNEVAEGVDKYNEVLTIDNHPAVGFGEFHTSEFSTGFEQRRPILTVPLSSACRDTSFTKLFYLAERRLNYNRPFVQNRIEWLQQNLSDMGASELAVSE